jgi:hypothetical protein
MMNQCVKTYVMDAENQIDDRGLISHPGIMMVSTAGLDVDISADALAQLLVVTQSYMRRPSLLEIQVPVVQ